MEDLMMTGNQPEALDPAVGDLFKAYDIRGIVPTELTPEIAYQIGRATAAFLGSKEVVVGRDMRLSGPALSAALIDGLRDQGANVTDIGLVSTDTLYFAVGKYGYDAGVMITASHNPARYNGFKICREEARALSMDTGIGDIRDMVLSGDFPKPADRRGDLGERDVLTAYSEHALGMIDVGSIKSLKIAIDAGNGMAGKLIPGVFEKLPCEVARFPITRPIRSNPRISAISSGPCWIMDATWVWRSMAMPTGCS
jgi:phosphomannomutase